MPKKELNLNILKEKFDEQIRPIIKKIVTEEALTGVVSKVVNYDYWDEFVLELEIPVIFKASKVVGTVDTVFRVDVNITIE